MTTVTPMVSVCGVHKFFGDLHVLRGIDLDIASGEVCYPRPLGISGKSTLLRCLNMLEDISAGRVCSSMASCSATARMRAAALHERHDSEIAAQRSGTGMVFQRASISSRTRRRWRTMEAPVQVLKRSEELRGALPGGV